MLFQYFGNSKKIHWGYPMIFSMFRYFFYKIIGNFLRFFSFGIIFENTKMFKIPSKNWQKSRGVTKR
eukprot:UN08417